MKRKVAATDLLTAVMRGWRCRDWAFFLVDHQRIGMIFALLVATGITTGAIPGRLMGAASRQAGTGQRVTLRGVIKSKTPITEIEAVERNRADVLALSKNQPTAWVFPGKWHKSGKFAIPDVPAGHTYDIICFNSDGRWEGVNMRYFKPVNAGPPMTRGDVAQLVDFIEKIERFTNYNRPIWINGDHNHATMVVEQLDTKSYVTGHKGSIIFRVAVWYFQRYYSGWTKMNNMGKVMTRWRGPAENIQNPWQYLPALGGIRVHESGKYKAISTALPPPSPHHGLDGAIPH